MIKSVTLLGSSSGRNAGDAALIAGIMDSIDEDCGQSLSYEIPTIRPSFIRNNYRNRTVPISMAPWSLSLKMLGLPTYKSIMSTDLSLIFDAILFDRSLYNPLFNYLSTVRLLLPMAKRRGKKMGFYNVGAGPVDSKAGRSMLRDLSEMMDFITVRDEDSLALLKDDLGVKNPRMIVTADAALTVEPTPAVRVDAIVRDLNIAEDADTLGVNINAYLDTWVRPKRPSMGKEAFLKVYAAALNRFYKATKATIVFISTQHHDVQVTKQLRSLLDPGVKSTLLSNVIYNHYDIKGVMGRLSMLFGMRLHATILSSSALTPTIGLAYQPKVLSYFKTLKQPELCISFDEFTADEIYRKLIHSWEARGSIRSKLEQRIPELQVEARRAARLVGAMHRGEDIDLLFRDAPAPIPKIQNL